MSPLDRVRWCLITGCGLGTSPVAPGTVGTLGGVAIAVALQWALRGSTFSYLWAWAIAAAVLIVYGCLETKFVARTWPKKDPGQFVLDEITGYLVTVIVYALVRQRAPDYVDHMAAFFAFRAFDVLKLQPCRRLEDIPGAPGIMADDQMAGVYAGLSMWLVMPLLGR